MLPSTTQACRKRTQPCPILVLGVGNILLRDEGVGVRVVEAMKDMELPPGVELFDGATAGIDLLDVLADRRKVIIIDAVEGDYEPGTVLRLTPKDLASPDRQEMSVHEIGLLETLAMVRHLGVAPQEVVILGVKPEDVGLGLSLSPRVARLVPRVIESVLADLRE